MKKTLVWSLLALGVVVIFAVGYGLAYFWLSQQDGSVINEAKIVNIPEEKEINNVNEDVEEVEEEDVINEEKLTIVKEEDLVLVSELEVADSEEYSGDPITWLEEREMVSPEEEDYYLEAEKIGTVNQGKYKGWNLYLQTEHSLGTYYHYAIQEGNLTGITSQALQPSEELLDGLYYSIKSFEYDGFTFEQSDGQLKLPEDLGENQETVLINGHEFLLTSTNCLALEQKDHMMRAFNIDLPFINPENRLVEITFNDGSANQESYSYIMLNCGYFCLPLETVSEEELQPDTRLEVVGYFSNGEEVYEIADSNDSVLQDLYNDEMTMAYRKDDWSELPENKYTYEEFLGYHPLLYWKGPFNQWVEFKNNRFDVAAEMCKPVVYLYPEETTELSVKVFPNGGFTHTEPEYGQGWEVTANPEGEIADSLGNIYPYLLWEGIGINYPEIEEGFVVGSSDVEKFLEEKLTILGLQGRELDDFKEYWVDRVNGLAKPYYKISFLEQAQINALSPLEINPQKPRTVIRIMMTVEALEFPETVKEQVLTPAPVRQGFTVVEWGGAVLN